MSRLRTCAGGVAEMSVIFSTLMADDQLTVISPNSDQPVASIAWLMILGVVHQCLR